MMDRLPLIVKRLVAISLLALSVALFWLTAIAPLEAQFAVNRAAIEDTRLKYQRYRSVADYASQLDDFAKQLDTDRFKGLILGGDSDAVALAGLQSTMQTLAVSNNAQVLSAQALPRFIDGDVRMVGVRVDLTGDLTAVQSTLHEIESNNPLCSSPGRSCDGARAHPKTPPMSLLCLMRNSISTAPDHWIRLRDKDNERFRPVRGAPGTSGTRRLRCECGLGADDRRFGRADHQFTEHSGLAA